MGWLSGWQYRKSHVINGAGGAGTNYQVKIIAHYGSGTDSGADVYLNSHCRTDFGDIRFTKSDGETQLDYWMETKVDGDYAIFWVEVADDLSTNPTTIYIYYGKSDATTTSNGAATFIDFDDFEGYTEGQNLIGVDGYSQANTPWDSPSYFHADSLDGNRRGHLYGTGTTYSEYVKVDFVNPATSNFRLQFLTRLSNVISDSFYVTLYDTGGNQIAAIRFYNGYLQYYNGTAYVNVLAAATNTWYKIRLDAVDPSNIKLYVNDTYYVEVGIGSSTAIFDYMRWGNYKNWTGDAYLDNRFIAKYVDPEPAHGSWGSEETSGGGVTCEIYVDAQTQALAPSTYEATYNIAKDASVASQGLHASEITFNLPKDAIVKVLADALVEVLRRIIEIFKDAVTTAQMLCQSENTFNIHLGALAQALIQTLFELGIAKEAIVKASTTNSCEVTFTLPLWAVAGADALSLFESTFNVSPEATVKVQAEIAIVKESEIKVTKLFLLIGDLAIQIQG